MEAFWLYNKGNEFTARTGGWGYTYNGEIGSFVKNNNYIQIKGANVTNSSMIAITSNYIDISEFDKISIDLECDSSNVYSTWYIILFRKNDPNNANSYRLKYSLTGGTSRNTFVYDISAYNEEVVPAIYALNGSTVNIYSVLLS